MEIESHLRRYLDEIEHQLDINIFYNLNCLEDIINILARNDKKLFIAGNGGSAATAMHFAEDMIYSAKRSNVISLVNNVSLITAIANDEDYDDIFVRQLYDDFVKNDILFIISCSGNSPNVVKAAEYATNIGTVIGLLGFDGGNLKTICDQHMLVNMGKGDHWKYAPIEDIHLMICHMIATSLEELNAF